MDGVIEQSCGCPGTRVVCSIRGAVAGGAAAELETWSLLPAVCPTQWKQLSEQICPPIHTPDSYPIHTPIHTLLLPFAAKSLLRSGQY